MFPNVTLSSVILCDYSLRFLSLAFAFAPVPCRASIRSNYKQLIYSSQFHETGRLLDRFFARAAGSTVLWRKIKNKFRTPEPFQPPKLWFMLLHLRRLTNLSHRHLLLYQPGIHAFWSPTCQRVFRFTYFLASFASPSVLSLCVFYLYAPLLFRFVCISFHHISRLSMLSCQFIRVSSGFIKFLHIPLSSLCCFHPSFRLFIIVVY